MSARTGSRPSANRYAMVGSGVGILFLAYPVLDIVSHRLGASAVIPAALLGLFAAAYFGAFAGGLGRTQQGSRLVVACVVLMAALAATLPFVYGASWVVLSFYVAILLTIELRQRPATIAVGLVTVFLFVQALLIGEPVTNAAMSAAAAAAIGGLMLGFVTTRKLLAELQASQAEVARMAIANERLRFARDLHDLLGHTLSLIALKTEVARKLGPTQPERVAQEVADVERIARDALSEVRQAVSGYRHQGLQFELDQARATLRAAGVAAVVDDGGHALPQELDRLLAWGVREAVTNVVRHAGAQRCEIVVGQDGRGVHLRVSDDGKGGFGTGPGNGLRGLAERVHAAHGSFHAGPASRGGFSVEISLPDHGPGGGILDVPDGNVADEPKARTETPQR